MTDYWTGCRSAPRDRLRERLLREDCEKYCGRGTAGEVLREGTAGEILRVKLRGAGVGCGEPDQGRGRASLIRVLASRIGTATTAWRRWRLSRIPETVPGFPGIAGVGAVRSIWRVDRVKPGKRVHAQTRRTLSFLAKHRRSFHFAARTTHTSRMILNIFPA
jgi:hypothetical protein